MKGLFEPADREACQSYLRQAAEAAFGAERAAELDAEISGAAGALFRVVGQSLTYEESPPEIGG